MKLVRFGVPGDERPGVIDGDGRIRDLSGHVEDIASDALSDENLRRLAALDAVSLPLAPANVRIGPCGEIDVAGFAGC